MFKSRHATGSAVGPIVTKIGIWIGMSSVVKAPLYYQILLFSYVMNSQNPGYKFAPKNTIKSHLKCPNFDAYFQESMKQE